VAAYAAAFTERWVGSSQGQVLSVAGDAVRAGEDPLAALTTRLDEWQEKRPDKLADWETSQAGNAVTVETYRAAGVQPIFSAGANACPICEDADGQPVSEVGYAPLHAGCACSVEAG
jgi:hypothetical protein